MPRLEDLRAALASQAGPLTHVEAAHQEAWGLVHARSLAEGTPAGAWRKTRAFLEDSRPVLKRHRETLDQHQIGIDRAAKLEGEQQIGYLAKMGDHFSHRVRELDQFKEDLLDTSAAVGAEPELQRVDTLLTLMSYAAGDLARQAKEYAHGLSSPAAPSQQVAQPAQAEKAEKAEQPDLIGDLIAAPATAAGVAVGTTMETAGEVADSLAWGGSLAPAALGSVDDRVAFYRDNYGVEMRFAADGRPILEPIGDLSLTLPQRGLGLGLETPSLSHGDQAY